MPTIIRKQVSNIVETRRDVYMSSWQVHSSIWTPPTDVYENESSLIVKVEVAGMQEEDFEVAVEDQILIIRGNRQGQNERRAYHQMEIRFGEFEIAAEIPVMVDIEKAIAEYKDGFLVIILPKVSSKQDRSG